MLVNALSAAALFSLEDVESILHTSMLSLDQGEDVNGEERFSADKIFAAIRECFHMHLTDAATDAFPE
jgi:hypothetical protein